MSCTMGSSTNRLPNSKKTNVSIINNAPLHTYVVEIEQKRKIETERACCYIASVTVTYIFTLLSNVRCIIFHASLPTEIHSVIISYVCCIAFGIISFGNVCVQCTFDIFGIGMASMKRSFVLSANQLKDGLVVHTYTERSEMTF